MSNTLHHRSIGAIRLLKKSALVKNMLRCYFLRWRLVTFGNIDCIGRHIAKTTFQSVITSLPFSDDFGRFFDKKIS